MLRQLFLPALTFLLGLAVGGLALGQKPATPGIAEGTPESPEPLGGGSAFVEDEAADSSPAGPAETPGSEAGALTIDLGPMSETEQIRMLIAGWSDLEGKLGRLAERVNGLELLVAAARQPGTTEQPQSEAGQAIGVLPTDTPENRRRALVAAGVSAAEAEEIVWRQSDQQLGRLELQDRAVREGWYRSDRYYEELEALNATALDLRSEVGNEAYDLYLYQTGEPNRLRIESVFQGSAAEQSGLQPGDIIESYGGESVFSLSDLRDATTQGSRDEVVPVVVSRGNEVIETWVQRGPVGVGLEATSVRPRE